MAGATEQRSNPCSNMDMAVRGVVRRNTRAKSVSQSVNTTLTRGKELEGEKATMSLVSKRSLICALSYS